MVYGTLSVLDTLAASSTTTIVQFGEDRAWDAVSVALEAHNRIMNEMIGDLAEPTADRLRRTGGDSTMTAQELDEYGVPAPQKISAGANVGFPLRRQGNALQWTRDWMMNRTPAELAAQVNAIMDADRRMIIRDIKRALFYATNYTFTDRLIDNVELPVKRLANADSHPIPPDPDGEAFDASTHTHYLARAGGAVAQSDITGLLDTVREHFSIGELVLEINAAQEAAVRAFADFVPYYDQRVIVANDVTRGAVGLDVVNTNDRAIGILAGAEVRVRPYVPSGYYVARIIGQPPLVVRTRTGQGVGALELVGDWDQYPLRANIWRRDYGFGVQNRVSAAALYGGNTSYTNPTLT